MAASHTHLCQVVTMTFSLPIFVHQAPIVPTYELTKSRHRQYFEALHTLAIELQVHREGLLI